MSNFDENSIRNKMWGANEAREGTQKQENEVFFEFGNCSLQRNPVVTPPYISATNIPNLELINLELGKVP